MAGADADYVIDVSTTFSGAQTINQLDTLTEKLVAGGTGADVFHDAIAKVTNQLTASKAATMAANAELVEGNTRYQELERAAQAAGIAFEKAGKTGVIPPGVEAAYLMTTAAVNDQAAALKVLETTAKAAGAEEVRLGATLKNVQALAGHTAEGIKTADEAQKKATTSTKGMDKALETTGKKLLGSIPGLKEYASSLEGAGASSLLMAGGAVAVVVAVVAVTAAILAGTVAIAGWAIGLANSARAQELNYQALVASNDAYAAVGDSLEDLTYDTGLGQAALLGLTKKLIDAKVATKDLPEALQAAALAESALGQGGADDFIAKMKAGKLAVNDFAATAQNKFGGIVAKQLLGLDQQSARLKQNVSNLFGGLNIEGVLTGLQRLVALFDDSTAAGQAIKVIFEGVFQPLINSVDKASVVVEAFVLGVLIGLTKLYIQAKPVIKYLEELFGFDDPATADTMATVTAVAEKLVPVMVILAGIFTALALVVGVSLVAALAAIAAPFVLIAGLIYGVVAAISALYNSWGGIVKFIQSISLADVGQGMIDGLVQGIFGAGPAVLKALGGIVSGAVAGVKGMLGIHSPSTVFAEIGDNTGQGFVQGVEGTEEATQAAMTSLVEPPSPSGAKGASTPATSSGAKGASTPATSSGGGGGGGALLNFAGANFNFYGVKDAQNAKQSFKEMLTEVLKGDAASISGHINAEPAT